MEGIIYVAGNPSYGNMYKIGKTTRPVEVVLRELRVISLVYSYLWFYHIAVDGISQVAGIILYGIIALILIIIQTIICNVKVSSKHNNRNN